MVKKIVDKLICYYKILTEAYYIVKSSKEASYRIEEIKSTTGEVKIYCYGARNIITLPLHELLRDSHIIDNLSSIQACWLGYHLEKTNQTIFKQNGE